MSQQAGKKLTGKQKKWLEAYFVCGFNAAEAARRAGYANPAERGYENRHHPDIAPLIEARMAQDAMSAKEVIARLTNEAQGDMSEFTDKTTGRITPASILEAQERGLGPLIKRMTVKDTKYGEEVTIELYDAQAAKAHLGRYHKLFTDKVEHSVDEEQLGKVDKLKDLFQSMRQREDKNGHSDPA